jgi:hypothetical protein
MSTEDGDSSEFSAAVYYAPRSYVEIESPQIAGDTVEIAIPLTELPTKLASADLGAHLRIQFRGKRAKPSPLLNAAIRNIERTDDRQIMHLQVLDWDRLARYWRLRSETPNEPPR